MDTGTVGFGILFYSVLQNLVRYSDREFSDVLGEARTKGRALEWSGAA